MAEISDDEEIAAHARDCAKTREQALTERVETMELRIAGLEEGRTAHRGMLGQIIEAVAILGKRLDARKAENEALLSRLNELAVSVEACSRWVLEQKSRPTPAHPDS